MSGNGCGISGISCSLGDLVPNRREGHGNDSDWN